LPGCKSIPDLLKVSNTGSAREIVLLTADQSRVRVGGFWLSELLEIAEL
jgi:hypothetical protein